MTAISYKYKAVDKAGTTLSGVTTGADRAEAYRRLAALGLTPLTISESTSRRTRSRGGVSSRDLSHFTYQLGVLTAARIPLADGLMSIASQEREGTLRDAVVDIATRIESGETVAAAIGAHRAMFGDVYVETIRSAEQSGNLIKVLEHLSEMLERTAEMRQQVRAASMYPLCVVCVLMGGVTFLIGWVVPKFADIFKQRGVKLPPLTQMLMVIGQSVQQHWWAYGLALVVGAALSRSFLRTQRGRDWLDGALHRVPMLGTIRVGLAVSRFARVLGLTLSSGLLLLDCLDLAGRASGRAMLKRDMERMIDQVKRGGRLSDVLPACTYLPGFAKRMLTAGEEAAELPRMCGIVARHYDRDSSYLVKNISTLIEPVLIVLIAAVVLVVALAIFLPMWDMVGLVG